MLIEIFQEENPRWRTWHFFKISNYLQEGIYFRYTFNESLRQQYHSVIFVWEQNQLLLIQMMWINDNDDSDNDKCQFCD